MEDMYVQLAKIIEEKELKIPLTVPQSAQEEYRDNYLKATASSGRLFLFAGDQKIEHLNEDFYGGFACQDSVTPQHLFEIASQARIGVFATQLGLVGRYADCYRSINYVIKLNSKTNLVSHDQSDLVSLMVNTVEQVVEFKKTSGLSIVGIGYTLYLGSQYESQMMAEVGRAFYEAHRAGLITVLWCYPRGKAIKDEGDANLIAGAAGVAVCLGADFVKVHPPHAENAFESARALAQATLAAGKTRLICSGGKMKSETVFLEEVYHQIHTGGARGAAIGRNIYQKERAQAIKLCSALAAIILDDADVEVAKKLLE
jgi:fructose-bisphosphate aldolase / 6-deoxy-5-ketofructose 1-phosphate synthase